MTVVENAPSPIERAYRFRRRSTWPGRDVLEEVRADRVPQLAHRRRGREAVADDVADAERDRAVVEEHRVVPVAAHVGLVARGDVRRVERDAVDGRERGREQGLLERDRGLVVASRRCVPGSSA